MKPNGFTSPLALLPLLLLFIASTLLQPINGQSESSETDLEPLDRAKRWASASPPAGIAKLSALDVICGKDHMTVRAEFSGPFQGIVFSKGTYGQDACVYVKPHSSTTHITFKVYYDQCGTKPDLQGKYYENTIVIQYGTDIIEAWDEAKRLRCEWFEAYEKPATFRPAIPVADLDVVEMNFQGDDIDCWMEIQEGKGPWAREVSRIVPVGQPMTIVVSINDYNGHFDMRVKSCFAHDGVKQPIQLTDEHGCVLRPKMLSAFNKVRDSNGKATIISYSHFYAFKFPDTMNVQIQCTVEVCRHGCPDACHKGPYPAPVREIQSTVNIGTHGHHQQQPQPGRRPEDEPKPVYQEVAAAASRPIPNAVHLPGISDQEVAAHATRFLEAQGVDIGKLNHHQVHGDPRESLAQAGSVPAPQFDASQPALNIGAELEPLEDESKPVIKVVDINVPDDRKKPATISEQPPMFPQSLNEATQLLSNLGLNVDLGSFAQGFIKNMQNKDINELLKNEEIRQLAAASGMTTGQLAELVPKAQALVNESGVSLEDLLTTTVRPQPVYEAEGSSAAPTLAQASQPVPAKVNHTQPAFGQGHPHQPHQHQQPPHQQQQQIPPHLLQQAHQPPSHPHPHPQQQQQPHPQAHQQQVPPHALFPGHPAHPGHLPPPPPGLRPPVQSRPPPPQLSADLLNKYAQQQAAIQAGQPVVQVMNIPLQPGLPPLPQMPPAFTNFIQQPPVPVATPHSKPASRPLFFGGFNLPTLPQLRLPSIFGGAQQREDTSATQATSPQAQSVTQRPLSAQFPQGPRSMRHKRSPTGSEIAVNKRFQVVTAIDLAFFPNATTDDAPAVEGRREDIVYGVCVPLLGLAASLSCVLCVITCALAFSVAAVFRLNALKAGRKTACHS